MIATRLDALRVSTALGTIVLLTLISACSMVGVTERGANVEMMAIPGDGRTVPMPPKWMRKQIEQRMSQGRVPGYIEVPASRLRRTCRADEALLGCVVNLKGLKVTYIQAGLPKDVRHLVLVHEYAHDLYDWEH